MQKNIAGQKWIVFAFDRTTNAPKTGDAANITAVIVKDGGASTATSDTNPTERSAGYYEFDLAQAETNADEVILIPTSTTANIQVLGCPAYHATTPTSWASDVVQTGDSFARIGAAGVGLTNLGDTRVANLDATVSSRLAPGGTLATVTTVVGFATDAITASAMASDAVAEMQSGLATAAALSTVDTKIDNVPANAADALLGRNLAGGSDGGRTVQDALRASRNRVVIDGTTITVYAEDDTTPAWTGTVTRVSAEALQEVNPA